MFAAQQEKRFVPCVFFKVSTDHLFDNLESGKRNYCFGKKVCKKSWISDPKTPYEPCNNAFLGALFAFCGRGIQPPLNACVVVRIIIAIIFFQWITLLYTPCYFSINDRFKVAWLTFICVTNLTVFKNSSIRSQCEPPNRGTQRWVPPKCIENTF